ncbi:MAG: ABC transporter permease [Planctomycetota bacterium]
MILVIARKEFVDAWRDGRFRVGAVLMLLLLVTASLLAWHQTERMASERAAATAQERENWLEQGEKNSHSAGHYGVNVFKQVSPLSLFDRGIEPFVGTTLFLEAHRQNQASFVPAQDATSMRRFGELTASTGLQLLAPLLVILLAFGCIAGERERGTLRQVLSLGVSPRALVMGKTLGLAGALASLLVPIGITGALLVSQLETDDVEGLWSRAGGLAAAYGLYLGLLLVFSVAVSALAPNGRSALAILLAVWAGTCIVAPRLVTDTVHDLYPTPLLAEFEKEMNEDLQGGLDGHDPRSKRLEEFQRDTLNEHKVGSVQELPFNFQGHVMLESERMAAEVFDHHFGKLWDRIEEQDRATTLAGVVSPLLALRSASMAFAGTDFGHHRHFAVAAEQHRREFVRVLNEALKFNARPGDHTYTAGRKLWESLPGFRLVAFPAERAFERAGLGLALLSGWFLAGLAVLSFAAGRLRVTVA